MAKRDPYAVPRRGPEVGGPLIRWTILLGLGAAGAVLIYHLTTAEPDRQSAMEASEAARSEPQYATAPEATPSATDLEAPLPGAVAPGSFEPSLSEPAAAPAEPPLSEPASAPARERPRRRPTPPPDPVDQSVPPPVTNFPAPSPPAPPPPVDTPAPPPPT